jgi:uncharacterized protein YbjT (DUF2867 family)
MKTAILAGTTGLIGAQVLELLLKGNLYDRVVALSRRPLATSHPKVASLVIDFDDLEKYADQLKGDDVYCCLGTTMKQAGSREAFQKVDFQYPVSLASITRSQGAKQFLLVTAMGANEHSPIFYNRVKGEVQAAVGKLGFPTFHIFQPSMLVGPRTRERTGEKVAQQVMKFAGFLIPSKYKAIESVKVARAMIAMASRNHTGTFIHESDELQSYWGTVSFRGSC